MSILDRSTRWGGWFDRLIEVRDSGGPVTIASFAASSLCDLEDQIDTLQEMTTLLKKQVELLQGQNSGMKCSLEMEQWAREVRMAILGL